MSPTPELFEAYWVLDSRGDPTVAVSLTIGSIEVTALVPSGASKGKKEAVELRDKGPFFSGKGVDKAVNNVRFLIAPAISHLDVSDQRAIDQAMIELDGTENKRRLGANAILAVSMAVARAAAEYKKVPLFCHLADLFGEGNPSLMPTPLMNVINGGAHADNGLPFQEFMIAPVGAETFSSALRMGSEVYHEIGRGIAKEYGYSGLGDEGGYAPRFKSPSGIGKAQEALNMIMMGITGAGYVPERDIAIALDPAAGEFYKEGLYQVSEDQRLTSSDMVGVYQNFRGLYPIISIEDGLAEGDGKGWRLLTRELGDKLQLVGDDLFVTNGDILRRRGIKPKIANAILIKPNQIGTFTETLVVIRLAWENGYKFIISHRSGETEDTTIADLAVATNAGQIKTGAPARGERTAKYNRLLKIERELGSKAQYAGRIPFKALAA